MSHLDRPHTSDSYHSEDKGSNSPNYAVNELPHDEVIYSSEKRNIDDGFDPAMIRRVTRKIDWRLVPYLAAAYSVSLIDRTNISLARAAGMNVDLLLSVGNRYSICVILFFVPYIIFELPSQLGLRKFGAAKWLSTAVTLWGVVLIGMAFVKTWQQLAATRALVGLFEAALFPGCAYLISCWYPRRQVQKRLSFFYTLSILATGLSSILAYGLQLLNGKGGLRGWRWIFLVEGILTVVLGLVGYVAIIDFPDKAKNLRPDEKEMILERIQRDRADAVADTLTKEKFIKYTLDWKLWVFAFMFFASTCGSYALSYFLPRILAGMGFDAALSQILVAPPYVWALVPAIGSAVMSDRTQIRSVWIMFNATCAVMGLALFAFLPLTNTAGRYAGIFLCAGGCNANVPLIIGWAQCSIRAQSCRAYTSALIVAFGGVGGIVSAVTFTEKSAPKYTLGISFTLAVNALNVVLCALLSFYFRRRNRAADKEGVILEELKGFRYQL